MLTCLTVPGLMWLFSPRASIPAFPGGASTSTFTLSSEPPAQGASSPAAAPPSPPPAATASSPAEAPTTSPPPAATASSASSPPPAATASSPPAGAPSASRAPAAQASAGARSVASPAPAPGELAWPLAGSPTGGFGFAYSEVHGDWRLHAGIDLAGDRDAAVKAAAAGVVRLVSHSQQDGWVVEIEHGGGVVTSYAHLGRVPVRQGDTVRQGQVVGYLGEPGEAEPGPPHLHFEVRVGGTPQDPAGWLASR